MGTIPPLPWAQKTAFYIFGHLNLEDITTARIAHFQAMLRDQGKSRKTIRNIVGVLASVLRVAMEWELLDDLPKISYPKLLPVKFRFLSVAECNKMEAAATPYWKDMLTVARKTGLRLGELCALEWGQVDFERQLIVVDQAVWRGYVRLPKHDRIREVSLSPQTAQLLKERYDEATSSLVFPNTEGNMRQERKCDTGLRRIARKAGVDPFGWHVLRHTFASHLVMAGEPLVAVQQLLGHSDIRVTMRYAHLTPGRKADTVAVLDHLEERPRHNLGTRGGRAADPRQARNAKTLANSKACERSRGSGVDGTRNSPLNTQKQ